MEKERDCRNNNKKLIPVLSIATKVSVSYNLEDEKHCDYICFKSIKAGRHGFEDAIVYQKKYTHDAIVKGKMIKINNEFQ